jgi:transmembrane sensor
MEKIILTKDNLEEIIGKYLDTIASPAELSALQIWRRESSDNEGYFQQIKQTNSLYSDMKSHPINVDNAWIKVNSKMKINDQKIEPENRIFNLWKYARYAASIIVLVSATWWLIPNQKPLDVYSSNTQLNYQLDDGSIVNLSANSALNRISKDEREFNFSGSANFTVVHNDEKPFIINMPEVIVKDLGTVFNIDAQPMSDTVFVKVTEGVVQFYTKTDDGIMLEHGEEGMYIKSKNKFYKRSIDVKNQVLSIGFQNETFGDVIDHLSYSFRKEVKLENEALRNCNITVDFSKAPYSLVKEIIEETLNVSIVSDVNVLTFIGEGCE